MYKIYHKLQALEQKSPGKSRDEKIFQFQFSEVLIRTHGSPLGRAVTAARR